MKAKPTFEFHRRPFILRPERKQCEPWLEVLTGLSKQRSGDLSWVQNFVVQMTASGKSLGISFDFGGSVGNSLDSLRLLFWAGHKYGHTQEGQEKLADILARYHFEQKRTVGKHENLLSAVQEAKFDLDEARDVLNDSSKYKNEVLSSILETQRQGVHSIPQFTFSWCGNEGKMRTSVHGSAPVSDFVSIIQNIYDDFE